MHLRFRASIVTGSCLSSIIVIVLVCLVSHCMYLLHRLLDTPAALHTVPLSISIASPCKCCPSGCHKPLKGDRVDRTVALVLSNISRHPRVCSGYREYLDGIGNRHVQHEVQVQSRPCARYLDSSARAANQMPSNQCHQSKVSDPRDTWAREKCEERSVITHGRISTRLRLQAT
jgi:hypothetical protein